MSEYRGRFLEVMREGAYPNPPNGWMVRLIPDSFGMPDDLPFEVLHEQLIQFRDDGGVEKMVVVEGEPHDDEDIIYLWLTERGRHLLGV